jgi:hypothetical protein
VACPADPITVLVLAVALAFPRNVAAAQPASAEPTTPSMTEVGFDSGRWTFYGGPATPAVTGRDTAWAVPGVALLRGVTFEDGVIEVDVSPGFPALVFHAESSDEYETVYLRTPSSGRADALQYSPVHRRFLPWRLYHDGQAPATFTPAAAAGGPAGPAARTHVRAVVQGRAVRVYVNRAATPSLVATLRHPARGGAIGVWSMAIVSPAMQYAHFRYAGYSRPTGAAANPPATAVQPGAVTQWELSPPLPGADVDAYPAADSARRWQPVTADFDGLVNVSRYVGALAVEGRIAPIAARATLTRERAGLARLAFAYCDRAAVFLNGRRPFSGTLPLSQGGDSPRLAARDTLALDLRAGPNELLVVGMGMVYMAREANGGWGFAARLVPDASAGARTSRTPRPAPPSGAR